MKVHEAEGGPGTASWYNHTLHRVRTRSGTGISGQATCVTVSPKGTGTLEGRRPRRKHTYVDHAAPGGVPPCARDRGWQHARARGRGGKAPSQGLTVPTPPTGAASPAPMAAVQTAVCLGRVALAIPWGAAGGPSVCGQQGRGRGEDRAGLRAGHVCVLGSPTRAADGVGSQARPAAWTR